MIRRLQHRGLAGRSRTVVISGKNNDSGSSKQQWDDQAMKKCLTHIFKITAVSHAHPSHLGTGKVMQTRDDSLE